VSLTAIVGGRVLTMNDHRQIFESGTVLIEGNRIIAVGRDTEVDVPAEAEIIDASGQVVMPGLVNAHTHGTQSLLRAGGNQDWDLLDWMFNDLYPGLAAYSLSDVRVALELFCLESIRSGVTTVVLNDHVHPFDPLPAVDVAVEVLGRTGLRAVYARMFTDALRASSPRFMDTVRAREPHVHSASVLRDTTAILNDLDEMYRRHDNSYGGRVRVCASPSTASTTSLQALEFSRDTARARDGIWALHLSETPGDRPASEMSAVRFLDSHGLLDSRLLLGHCVHVDAADIRMIRRGGASISTQPVSNGVLGSGIAPVPAFLQAGINVGIGTDDANCNDACDVLSDLKTLGVVQRAVNCDAAAVTAEELIELATLGGARAVRQGSDIGRLAAGYKADIVLVDTRRPHLTPSSSIPAMLAWQASGRDVHTVLIDGRVVMRDGIVDWLDGNAEADLLNTASERAEKIAARAGIATTRPWASRAFRSHEQ